MRLRDKVRKKRRPVVIYEIIPPRIVDGTIESYAEKISTLLSRTHIDAINIPEVHSEKTRGNRPVEEKLRSEPREFGRLIQDTVGIEAIINRVTVMKDRDYQQKWFSETYEKFGIDNIILVGGESSKINYPGPSVIESSNLIRDLNNSQHTDIFCGGISLPSRKFESETILKKTVSGIEYFTTQVLYESRKICKLLKYYHETCIKNNQSPKRIILSFAPISTNKNLKFLQWLGVEIPEKTIEIFENNENDMLEKSIQLSLSILDEIFAFQSDNGIAVPIGLNIEHIMHYNFEHSVRLLQMMSKKYRKYCMESKLFA